MSELLPLLRQRWITDWHPENEEFWRTRGKRIAYRNLCTSIFVEHIGFSIWSLWSVLVLFMGPKYGLTPSDKFLLVSTASFVGALLRIPYGMAVAWLGGRNWTIVSAALLLIPTGWALCVMHPGTSFGTFLVVAAITGFGGGNFASSMANINGFFPERRKGTALGLNAGGGNVGVAVIQLVALLVLGVTGAGHPRVLLWIYLPLIVISLLCALRCMDNLEHVRDGGGGMREVLRDPHAYVISLLYIGTFGSFIGFGFAFGLVLQNQFDRTPIQAAAVTFLGPLLGSLSRPVGGWLADRYGGALVTLLSFAAMALATVLTIAASGIASLALFSTAFVVLFVFSGVGNGATYKMIPVIYRGKALTAISRGAAEATAWASSRRGAGALIGLAAATGALGGVLINLAFRSSFQATGSGAPACYGFLVYYLLCLVLTWTVYLRRGSGRGAVSTTEPATPATTPPAMATDRA